jgi:hypothetical protein
MNYRALILCCLFTMSVCSGTAPSVKELVKSIQSSKTANEFSGKIKLLGLPDSLLSKYNKKEFSGYMERDQNAPDQPLFTKAHFVRAETFAANLNADTAKELISQVVFATGKEKTDLRVYLLFIHDAKNRLVYVTCYEMVVCDHVPENTVSFGFEPAPGRNWNFIKIHVYQVESCGDEVSFFERNDSLIIESAAVTLQTGKPYNEQSSNRFDELKDME